MEKTGYGVDFGGTEIKFGRFDAEGNLLRKWSIPTDRSDSGARIMPDIAREVRTDMENCGLTDIEVLGIGVTVPGPVTRAGTTAVNLGVRGLKADEELKKYAGLYCVCGNDANCAALGEYWKGSGAGYDSILLVTLGTGVGSGIVTEGKILNGFHGAAGEIGHIPVNFDEKTPDVCGCYGCTQQYASATGMVRLAQQLMRETVIPSRLRQEENLTAEILWKLAAEGDPLACRVADMSCDYLGRALAMGAGAVDPEAILLGGGVSRAGEALRSRVEKAYRRYAFFGTKDVKIVTASLGSNAGIYGAVKLLMDRAEETGIE